MSRAIHLAIGNVRAGRGGPFAAVIARGDEIVAEGVNLVTSSNDPTAHAEVVAIRRACEALGSFQLAGCELYTSCEPCPMCMGAVYWARLDRVYFAGSRADAAVAGFDDSFIYDQLALPLAERAIPMVQILRDEAREAFRLWMDHAGRIAY